ncbi:hypothetical protein Patl1_29535 [Pistacia atlantica]|uniref:Uncharacterized protein n=1 Tax=Pistacia atlantica TaxID=434234 RepID=A0ACC1ABC0_9ROSI|nr:hypothetical protein Patl1_29535 [Pistacia atlantica]
MASSQKVFCLLVHAPLEKPCWQELFFGEVGVPFFSCNGGEFEGMFVGVGARRRDSASRADLANLVNILCLKAAMDGAKGCDNG